MHVQLSFGQNMIRWVEPVRVSEKVEKGNKMFLLYFHFNGCKWCKSMEAGAFQDDHTARFINQHFYAVKVNALDAETINLGQQEYEPVTVGKHDFNGLAVEMLQGRMSFPAIVVLNEKFEKIGVHHSYQSLDEFQKILAYYAGKHYKNTLFKHYSSSYCKESHFNSMVSNRQ
jgi:thioredoxin-related protein